jgi:hypothetical protein
MWRIQDRLGQIRAADGIQEGPWLDTVMKGLSEISKDCALDLQKEIGGAWDKGSYSQGLHEAPPTRLLALQIAVASWLGWIMREKHGENGRLLSTSDCWKRIEEAYSYGIQLSRNGETP